MRGTVSISCPDLQAAISNLFDEEGTVDLDELNARLDELGVTVSWPISINFGDLEYDNQENIQIGNNKVWKSEESSTYNSDSTS